MVFPLQLPPQQLRAALTSVPLASVTLHDSILTLHPRTVSMLVSALAGSAVTLTALHGLPLGAAQRDRPHAGLAAFTQLRALTLYQTEAFPKPLRATHLPASLEELTVASTAAMGADWMSAQQPALVAFDELSSLRRLTLVNYFDWRLRSEGDHDGAGTYDPPQLPHSLQVHSGVLHWCSRFCCHFSSVIPRLSADMVCV